MNEHWAARLNLLKSKGVIAGWQQGGGPNFGRSKDPLPALIFPRSGGPASTYYNDHELGIAVRVLETFGPTQYPG